MATPPLTTLINPIGQPVAGSTVQYNLPIANIPDPAGRNTSISVAAIRNQYILLNNFLQSTRFWRGQAYNEGYQNQAVWRRSFGRNADLDEDCDLWKNYNDNKAAIPKFIRENNINSTMKGQSISDLNKLIESDSGLRRTRGFRNSKEFWETFPPQVGYVNNVNKNEVISIEMYLREIIGLKNPKYSNKMGDTLTTVKDQVGNIKKNEGPQFWVDRTGGIGEEWRWMRPFWRISRNWKNYDKFKFGFDDMTAGYVGQNPYVLETFFEPTRGNWIYKPDYFYFGNTNSFKISNENPPPLSIEDSGDGIEDVIPGFYAINQGAFQQKTEAIVIPYYDEGGKLLKDPDLGYISDDGSTYIQAVYDEDNNRILLERKILRKEKYYKTSIELVDEGFPNTHEGLRERYKDYNGGKGFSDEKLKSMIITDEDTKIERVQLEYTPELSESLIEIAAREDSIVNDPAFDRPSAIREFQNLNTNTGNSPNQDVLNPNRLISDQQMMVESITHILYKDFVQMYGKRLTDQIQMPIDKRQNSSRYYFQLANNTDRDYRGNKRLTSPNQFLYNIAVEYVKSKYFWSVPDQTWDLSYLNDVTLPQNRIWDGTMYGGQGGYRFS